MNKERECECLLIVQMPLECLFNAESVNETLKNNAFQQIAFSILIFATHLHKYYALMHQILVAGFVLLNIDYLGGVEGRKQVNLIVAQNATEFPTT